MRQQFVVLDCGSPTHSACLKLDAERRLDLTPSQTGGIL